MQSLATDSYTYFVRFTVVAAASIAAALLGFLLLPAGGSATLIWPPSAVGIAVLFLYGYELWPALTLSILGVFLIRNGNIPFDVGIALGDTLEAVIGAYFLRKYVEMSPMLFRLRDSLGLLIACIAPTLVSALVITSTSFELGRIAPGQVESTFAAIWIGHAVSALSFAPFLIRWLHRPFFYKTKNEVSEGFLIFSSVAILSYLLFWTPYGNIGSVSLLYLLIIPLIWASLRSGPRGTTLALSLIALISTTGVLYGNGSLTTNHNPQTVFLLQVLLGVLDLIFLLFTSIVEERKEAVLSLRANVGQLQSAIEKIRSEDQAKTNFLAILAHELRNPLAPIITSVELLKTDPESKVDLGLIETIESHARTISLLLDDLLDISRITQNKFQLHRQRVALRTILTSTLESVQAFFTTRNHTLTITQPKENLFLDGDPVRLEQMLVNLLNNAAKYTDPNGTITVTCTREGKQAVIRVTDNGIGIAPEKLPGVFEPFGQRGAVLRTPGGLGVGLSLTKQLVELHGGSVEATSKGVGHGSTFTLRLPMSQNEPTEKSVTRSFVNRLRSAPQATTMQIILIVDDNEPAAKGIAALLTRSGHTTHIANSGTEALAKVSQLHPQCVILDIGLPDMTGHEVAQQILRMDMPKPRLIALSGYGQDSDRAKSSEAGFDVHLTKPVSLADLQKVL